MLSQVNFSIDHKLPLIQKNDANFSSYDFCFNEDIFQVSIHMLFRLFFGFIFAKFCISGCLFLYAVCSHKDVEDDNGSLSRVFGISEMLHNNQDFLDIHDFLGKRQ